MLYRILAAVIVLCSSAPSFGQATLLPLRSGDKPIFVIPETVTRYPGLVSAVFIPGDMSGERGRVIVERILATCPKPQSLVSIAYGVYQPTQTNSGLARAVSLLANAEWLGFKNDRDSPDLDAPEVRSYLARQCAQRAFDPSSRVGHQAVLALGSNNVATVALLRTIEIAGDVRSVWVTTNNTSVSPATDLNGDALTTQRRRVEIDNPKTRERLEINCKSQSIGNLSYTEYDSKGAVLGQSGRSLPSKQVIPDTVGESVLDFICYLR